MGCSFKSLEESYRIDFLELTKEANYKEALEISLEVCEEGLAEACRQAGDFYADALGTDRDLIKSHFFYQKACDGGDFLACATLGRFYYDGVGVDKNPKVSLSFFQKACDLGHNLSCLKLANFSIQERMQILESSRLGYLKSACEKNNAIACYNLGSLVQNREVTLSSEAAKEIAQDYYKACDLSYGMGCLRLIEIYEAGLIDKEDFNSMTEIYKKASKHLEQSCAKDTVEACVQLARMYEYGSGVAENFYIALGYRNRACELKDSHQCLLVGDYYAFGRLGKQDFKEAKKYYQNSCDFGNGDGCERVAYLYLLGKGVRKSKNQAENFYQKACVLGDGFACYQMKFIFNKRFKRTTKQTDVPQDACERRTREACYEIGIVYELGIGVPINLARAKRYYKAACAYGYEFACAKGGN